MAHVTRFGQYAENPPTGQRLAQIGGVAAAAAGFPWAQLTTGTIKAMSTNKGKRFILAANELKPGSIPMQKLIESFYKQLPKLGAVTGKTLTDDKGAE